MQLKKLPELTHNDHNQITTKRAKILATEAGLSTEAGGDEKLRDLTY